MTSRPKQIRWSVHLRGERFGEVWAENWQAACLRAMQRWADHLLQTEPAKVIPPRG